MINQLPVRLLRLWIAVVATVIVMSSCNVPTTQATETPASAPASVLDTPTSSIPSLTPDPVETMANIELPTVIPTSTSNISLASPTNQPVNCRFGPEVSYAVMGILNPGKQAEIIGRNEDSSWWYVRNPNDPSKSCWLSANFVQTVGNVQLLPVAKPPEIMVTGIKVNVEPPLINIACNAFPQVVTISADITTNGPSTVMWHWESNTGFVSPEKNMLFAAGDTQTVHDFYQVSSINDYIVSVQTTAPNTMMGQASFKVVCTP